MPVGYEIRMWQPGDETAILELFEASFGRRLAPEFWKWRFQDHPAGDPLVMLAWQGDRLVAHYGASQAPLRCDGQVVLAALSMTTMTHPDNRGLGLVEAVGGALYETLAEQGYAAVWGFPNAMINATRRRKLAWEPIDDVPALSVAVANARPPRTDSALVVEKLSEIDPRLGDLQDALAPDDSLEALRDVDTLRWRIDANPVNTYSIYSITTDGRVAGYAITKAFGTEAIDIVDLRAVDDAHCAALLGAVLEQARTDTVKQLNCWCLRYDSARLAVERFGFAATAPVTYFAGRPFSPAVKDFTDSRRWRLTMLDSDLY